MRQVVLDTETTGTEVAQGHRILEIGCLELIDRRITGRHFHHYVNPERESDAGALAVHGITQDFLVDKPLFIEIADQLLDFIKGAQLIIHNAPFDIGFLNSEFKLTGKPFGQVLEYCTVLDTLPLARQLHPGQRNNLDALCKRYSVNNSHRDLHGALLDAELLAKVYLAMTGGQTSLFSSEIVINELNEAQVRKPSKRKSKTPLRVITASPEELQAHEARIAAIKKKSKNGCLWEIGD